MLRNVGGSPVVTETLLFRPQRQNVPARRRNLRHVYTRLQFEAVLHHERARADRDENEFSLVLLQVRSEEWRTTCRMARAVLSRARSTDEVGWYGHGCLCVLLPTTSNHGARSFEASVRRL